MIDWFAKVTAPKKVERDPPFSKRLFVPHTTRRRRCTRGWSGRRTSPAAGSRSQPGGGAEEGAYGRGSRGRKPQPFGIQGTGDLKCAVADACGAEKSQNDTGGRKIK